VERLQAPRKRVDERSMTLGQTVRILRVARALRDARLRPRALASAFALLASVLAAAPASASTTLGNWDAAQQRAVSAAGLMRNVGGSFEGAGHLSASEANATMTALAARLEISTPPPPSSAPESGAATEQPGGGQVQSEQASPTAGATTSTKGSRVARTSAASAPVRTAQNPVTVITFDRMLVEQLGLRDVVVHVQATARVAGLRPPSYFGSEVVARFLELRYDHPAGSDRLELFPSEPITRAEAAWSLARVMRFGSWNVAYAREALSAFELPSLSGTQRQALQIAVSRIGYPYVWGGTTDDTADGLEHGGFDCSGFAWRVFKLSGLPWGAEIQGRTAAEQAGEISRAQRLRVSQLRPGDLLFFGHAHFNSTATERNIVHEGIYLGDNWVIHSSFQGVYVLPLKGSWLGSSFAWGRRVIR
jgi:cell wall-associated NlpC family hydrolase